MSFHITSSVFGKLRLTCRVADDSFGCGGKSMTYRHLTVVAVPVLMFLLWLIVSDGLRVGDVIAGIAVAVAIGCWAPITEG